MRAFLPIAAVAAVVLAETAAAQTGPVPSGGDCFALASRFGAGAIWWGRFSGGKDQSWFGDSEIVVMKTTEACFRRRADCERWLYALKSEYQFAPRYNQCRRGYAPGAPIPRL